MIDAILEHAPLWEKLDQLFDKNRLPQAFLFVGTHSSRVLQLVNRLIARIVCQNTTDAPCGQCKPCHLLSNATHPDILYVNQDARFSPIKIDQVRELQHTIYQTPQCGSRRIIVINPADKLNTAASNALLKILEEPPVHTIFILLAEQTATIPATILSRCQQYFVPSENKDVTFLTTSDYPEDHPRTQLIKQHDEICRVLQDIVDGKVSPCSTASKWSSHALGDLLWYLYGLTAQAIKQKLIVNKQNQPSHPLKKIDLVRLFKQLDQLNDLLIKVQDNITLNQTLAIEVLLLGYIP